MTGRCPVAIEANYVSVNDAATYAGVSPAQIRRWVKSGLPAFKPTAKQQGHVLIRLRDLDAYIESSRKSA